MASGKKTREVNFEHRERIRLNKEKQLIFQEKEINAKCQLYKE